MNSVTKFPISVHFVWHPLERDVPLKILSELQSVLFKQKTSEFSGCNEIPFFFYSSEFERNLPSQIELNWARKNIIFFFSGSKLVVDDSWVNYLESVNIKDDKNTFVVPVLLDKTGMNLPSDLGKINGIRLFDFMDNIVDYAILSICHEIQRRITENDESLKIFLSHCKRDGKGLQIIEQINSFICSQISLKSFFDVTEIRPGFPFEDEINKSLKNSSLMVLYTDNYSSSYWCQHEICYTKEIAVPIVVVDFLENCTDRLLPSLANVPSIRLDPTSRLTNHDIFRLLISVLVETIRCNYVKLLFGYYQNQSWIPRDNVRFIIRPPEIISLVDLVHCSSTICYPEPRLFLEEEKWVKKLGLSITSMFGEYFLDELSIGISISDEVEENNCFYRSNHIPYRGLNCLSKNLARQLILKGAQLIYGGNFRDDGYTNVLLKEIELLANDASNAKYKDYKLLNYLAWPLFNNQSMDKWYASHANHLHVEKCSAIEVEKDDKRIKEELLTVEDMFLYSKSLTKMREDSIYKSDVRICAGGKFSGYSGKMPGVLEEILISMRMKKKLFLIGGFGGITGKVCNLLLGKTFPEELTLEWQEKHTMGYRELLHFLDEKGEKTDYQLIVDDLMKLKVSDLAEQVGLTADEYKRLMETPFVDEIIHLILKGLSHVHK